MSDSQTSTEALGGFCCAVGAVALGICILIGFLAGDPAPSTPALPPPSKAPATPEPQPIAQPDDHPVLPEVVHLLELGMTEAQVLGLGASLDRRGSRRPFGASPDPRSPGIWFFTGYPKDYPKEERLDDAAIPQLAGSLEFKSGRLHSVWIISPSLGREVTEELVAQLLKTRPTEFDLDFVQSLLGPGIPVARFMRGSPDDLDLVIHRWCFFVAEGARPSWGVLNATIGPEGHLRRVSTIVPGEGERTVYSR